MTPHSVANPSASDISAHEMLAEPIFVVGAVRSGTTLLRLMLDHHPRIAFHFEFEFAVDQISPDGQFPELAAYHEFLAEDRIFQLSRAIIDPQLDYPRLVNSFLLQKRDRDGKLRVGGTVHRQFDRIRYVWPQAKYIHLLRDGRDAGRSCMAMGWAGSMYHGVARWQEAEETWDQLAAHIPPQRRCEVRYEELVADPQRVLTDVCHFIGEEFDPAMFDYAQNSSYGLPDPRLTQQWRRKLSDSEIQLAEARIGNLLTARGYELSGLPPLQLSPRQVAQLERQDWRRRAKFRLKRYGLPLLATDYIARHAGIRPLARRTLRRINAIDNQYLD
jgi:hypothetical protein